MSDKKVSIDEWLETMGEGFSEEELAVGWAAVRPMGDWKGPICQHIPAELVYRFPKALVQAAVDSYAGGDYTITDDQFGGYTVSAPGYRWTIGS